jgi:hypothetical protein
MKNFAKKVEMSTLAAPFFGIARQTNPQVDIDQPEELTSAEIAIVAGGPETEVVGGLPT